MITTAWQSSGHFDEDKEPTADSPGETLRRFLSEIQNTIQDTGDRRQAGERLQKLIRCAEHLEGAAAQMLLDAILVGECLAWACVEDFLAPPSGWDDLG